MKAKLTLALTILKHPCPLRIEQGHILCVIRPALVTPSGNWSRNMNSPFLTKTKRVTDVFAFLAVPRPHSASAGADHRASTMTGMAPASATMNAVETHPHRAAGTGAFRYIDSSLPLRPPLLVLAMLDASRISGMTAC